MDPARPGAGALLGKYLVGLLCLVLGLAVLLVGVFNAAHGTILIGFAIAALGAFLIVLKIIARNRPTH
ncbi:hypothetical protein [Caulobacter sp. 17J80-11]|uniref:hypothetical protein n=1 Tax=Caulobacter sp. 17J80-11 TaxID=2763502 RepID=UPI0016537B13|nr:hypothetical protein [Caulobacter sp. 17J80-11]MBC6981723.1 hypothetical protein [Caulobacter sp. 17J80-11]